MSFALCRKHLAETRKGHSEKANSTLERRMSRVRRFLSLRRQNCEKCPKHGKQSCSKD